jgi:serpin B
MVRLTAVLLTVALIGISVTADAKRRHRAQPTAGGAALASDELGLDLLKRTPAGNAALSPWSIWTALSMTHPGASGQTRSQIERVLDLNRVGNRPGVANRRLRRSLEQSVNASGARLDVANALWADNGASIKPPFLGTLARDFGAPAQRVDFRGDSEGARQQINDWVAEHTQGKITDLFGPGDIDSRTRLTIANALYFKAEWLNQFEPDLTRDEPFHAPGGDVSAPTMHRKATYRYARLPGYQAVALPYKGERLAMLILVPDRGTLARFQRKLTLTTLADTLAALRPTMIDLALPRFHVETRLSLEDSLTRLGMGRAFTDNAQFPRISDEALKVRSVVHRVWIDVAEKGTEAAAATGVTFTPVSYTPARRVDVDRPFLFLLGDRKTNAVLFMGRIENPTR